MLVRTKPLGQAGRICRRPVREVRVIADALWLDADPTVSSAVNTVLVKKGVKVSELVVRLSERNQIRVKQSAAGQLGRGVGRRT